MSVRKRGTRWQSRPKYRGSDLPSATFDTKREAVEWERQQRQRAQLGKVIDLKLQKEPMKDAWGRWSKLREQSVSVSAQQTDNAAFLQLPNSIKDRPVVTIQASQFESLYSALLGSLARSSVVRYRTSYGAFFSWAIRENVISANPALEVQVPKGRADRATREIYPLSFAELTQVASDIRESSGKFNADIALVLGLTGLRWGELAALRVRDFRELPHPALSIGRSKSDGKPLRNTTKGGRSRTVPLLDEALKVMESYVLDSDKGPDDLVFSTSKGNYLSLANWKRAAKWKQHSRGRTVKDLRHTFATNALALGVDLKTLQAWLGHASAKITADTYAHWMGSDADKATLDRLNTKLREQENLWGTIGGHEGKEVEDAS